MSLEFIRSLPTAETSRKEKKAVLSSLKKYGKKSAYDPNKVVAGLREEDEESIEYLKTLPPDLSRQTRTLLNKGLDIRHAKLIHQKLLTSPSNITPLRALVNEASRRAALIYLNRVAAIYGRKVAIDLFYSIGRGYVRLDNTGYALKPKVKLPFDLLRENGADFTFQGREVTVVDQRGTFSYIDDHYFSATYFLTEKFFEGVEGQFPDLFGQRDPTTVVDELAQRARVVGRPFDISTIIGRQKMVQRELARLHALGCYPTSLKYKLLGGRNFSNLRPLELQDLRMPEIKDQDAFVFFQESFKRQKVDVRHLNLSQLLDLENNYGHLNLVDLPLPVYNTDGVLEAGVDVLPTVRGILLFGLPGRTQVGISSWCSRVTWRRRPPDWPLTPTAQNIVNYAGNNGYTLRMLFGLVARLSVGDSAWLCNVE